MDLLRTSLLTGLLCAVVFPQSILAKDKLMDHALKFPGGDGPFPTVVYYSTLLVVLRM
jgi:hypothetical protein